MNLATIQRRLVLLGLLIVPFISIGELYALFSGGLLSQMENMTGVFKFSKDIVFILIVVVGLFDFLLKDRLNKNAFLYLLFVIIAVVPPILFSVGSELLLYAAGLRWLLPALLPIFLYKSVSPALLNRIATYVFYLLLLHLFIQFGQMFFASSWYGTSSLGFNLRNPGLFLIPNTGAFFTIASLYYILFISQSTEKRKIFVVFISGLSVFLTLSGTGLVVYLLILFFYFASIRMLKWFVLLIPVGMVFIYFFANMLMARDGDYVQVSGGTRLSIFVDSFVDSHLVSTEFGLGTNTAVMLGEGEIMDSTFASLIVNLGYIGFFLFMGVLMLFFLYSIVSTDKALFVFLIVFTLFSMTTIIYEVYPVNLIMGVLLVFFLNRENLNAKPATSE